MFHMHLIFCIQVMEISSGGKIVEGLGDLFVSVLALVDRVYVVLVFWN